MLPEDAYSEPQSINRRTTMRIVRELGYHTAVALAAIVFFATGTGPLIGAPPIDVQLNDYYVGRGGAIDREHLDQLFRQAVTQGRPTGLCGEYLYGIGFDNERAPEMSVFIQCLKLEGDEYREPVEGASRNDLLRLFTALGCPDTGLKGDAHALLANITTGLSQKEFAEIILEQGPCTDCCRRPAVVCGDLLENNDHWVSLDTSFEHLRFKAQMVWLGKVLANRRTDLVDPSALVAAWAEVIDSFASVAAWNEGDSSWNFAGNMVGAGIEKASVEQVFTYQDTGFLTKAFYEPELQFQLEKMGVQQEWKRRHFDPNSRLFERRAEFSERLLKLDRATEKFLASFRRLGPSNGALEDPYLFLIWLYRTEGRN